MQQRKKPRRRSLPDHLEVEEIIIEPAEVKAQPQQWRCIDQEVTEELDLVPAKFIKRLYIRKKYVSRQRPTEAPVIGPLPSRLIEKGIPGAGLLVHILLSKYADHLPLYRQQRIYRERYGVKLARQSMLGWMNQVAEWLNWRPSIGNPHQPSRTPLHPDSQDLPIQPKHPRQQGTSPTVYN